MTRCFNRRQILRGAGAASLAAFAGLRRGVAAAPKPMRIETKVISYQPHLYHGWPTLARRRNGQLLLVYSGGREAHVCPFGRVEWMQSNDGGQTWTWPRVLLDGPIDDRDAGVLETPQGSILVTTFTSLAYESILQDAERIPPGQRGPWPEQKLKSWQAAHRRLPATERTAELGVWMIRSTDGGRTWSDRYDSLVDSPHGPFALADGKLLYAGRDLWREPARVGVCDSSDDGQSWNWLAEIPVREGDDYHDYHELHGVETADGRIVVQIRNHNRANEGETLQCDSADGGKTWSRPAAIGVWGLPSHLVRLSDDRLLMTYGHRRPPFGNQARISKDHGRTWSEPMIISGDGAGGDLGYPSTVELDDGALLTVWYELMRDAPRAVLRQARWELS